MVYRRVMQEDLPKIAELCLRNSIDFDIEKIPTIGFVAVGEEGDLIGVVFAYTCALIEPFISINPTAAVKLHSMIEGATSAIGLPILIAHVKASNEKLNTEMIRAGFDKIDAIDYSLYKKVR